MSLVEMVQKIRAEVKREFIAWTFGRLLAQAIGYGNIMITIYQGHVSEVQVTLGVRPESQAQNG